MDIGTFSYDGDVEEVEAESLTIERKDRRSTDKKSNTSNAVERLGGSIRKVKQDRGYGFIAGDDGTDYFFHWTGFEKTSPKAFRDLETYDRVTFVAIVSKDRGPRAIQIRAV